MTGLSWPLMPGFCRTFEQVWREGILPFCHGLTTEDKEEKSGGQTVIAALDVQLGMTTCIFGHEGLHGNVNQHHSWGSLKIRLLHLSKDQHYCAGWM